MPGYRTMFFGPWPAYKEEILARLESDTGLTESALRVGINLLRHLNHRTQSAWPGVETQAREIGVDRRTVQRARRLLRQRGHFCIVRIKDQSPPERRAKTDVYASSIRWASTESGKRGSNVALEAARVPPEPEREPENSLASLETRPSEGASGIGRYFPKQSVAQPTAFKRSSWNSWAKWLNGEPGIENGMLTIMQAIDRIQAERGCSSDEACEILDRALRKFRATRPNGKQLRQLLEEAICPENVKRGREGT